MLYAQQFKIRASLQSADKTGFYSIDVTPELSALTGTGFSDVRIADEQENFVPYIIRPKTSVFYQNNYDRFNIISNTQTDSGRSALIIENTKLQTVNNIALVIRNASVNRMANISGSDNGRDWFTIAESLRLENSYSDSADRYIQNIDFPLSSYRYFKMIIDNGKHDALNILEAGKYLQEEKTQTLNLYTLNPAPGFTQVDSNSTSFVSIRQLFNYHVDKINIHVKGPKFFKREIEVETRFSSQNFFISSDSVFTFYVNPLNDKNILIKIYNGDNPPLTITSVTTEQRTQQIVTYLEAGKNYHLLLKDSLVKSPSYDLQQFSDSIQQNVPSLKVLAITDNHQPVAAKATSQWKNWLWPVMIIVLVVVGLFTLRLAKEVQKKQD